MRWLTAVILLGACAAPQPRAEEQTSLVRGSRGKSASIKASDNRPHPWEEEHSPFQADRMEIAAHRERERRRHQEQHSKQVLVLEQFSHPACSGLQGRARTDCPLLAVPWQARREVPGGVVLETRDAGVSGAQLQRQVLCHVAFGRSHGGEDGCPLHLTGVRASVVARDGLLRLRIVTGDPRRVPEVRRRVKTLVTLR